MIPDWAMRLPLNLIYSKANDNNLDANLIAAICWQESRGFVYAVRYEHNYKWLYRVDHFAKHQNITQATEEQLQKQSVGLMQIIGATARWLGFDGPLPALYKPENNLFWGCKYLKQLKDKHGSDESMVAAYNAGSPRMDASGKYINQNYVDSVMSYYSELKKK